jgi:hypothetical protein
LDEVASHDSDDARRDSRGSNCEVAEGPFVPVSCSTPFLGTPLEISQLAGMVGGDPTIRGDELEMFYVYGLPGAYRIARAVRASTTSEWMSAGDAPFADPTASETDPAINADGTYVAFISDRGGVGNHVYLAHRTCDTWEPVVPARGLESLTAIGIDLSWDALGLYYTIGDSMIYEVHRATTTDAFGTPEQVSMGGTYPSISSDELELYFAGAGGVYRATRTAVGTAFATPTLVTDSGNDPDVSFDGTGLLFVLTGNVPAWLRRTCP